MRPVSSLMLMIVMGDEKKPRGFISVTQVTVMSVTWPVQGRYPVRSARDRGPRLIDD